jgi:hypothetical protein
VKPTLERFMDPKDIPTQYGGQLEFKWGDLPSLDEEAKQAMEQGGQPGWIAGPCLWLDHKRVVVGSENGKPRRTVPNVQEMKPVVYAADDTEEPVHAHRRGSSVTSQTMKEKVQNGAPHAKLEKIQSENVVPQTAQAAAASAVPAETNVIPATETAEHAPEPATASKPEATLSVPATGTKAEPTIPSNIPSENLRKSPEGADVNMPPPEQQPAFPQQTAEYVRSNEDVSKTTPAPNSTEPSKSASAAPAAAAVAATTTAAGAAAAATATASSTLTNGVSPSPPQTASPHVPAVPEPGPTPEHHQQLNAAIAEKLAGSGESISVLPAQANGSLPHPEVVVSSDQSKGLALETEKIENLPSRPQIDRFVTAAEF